MPKTERFVGETFADQTLANRVMIRYAEIMNISDNPIDRSIAALKRAKSLVVFTGAGVSQESGVPTFRDAQTGLWATFDPEKLATPKAFKRDPLLVWNWYEYRRQMLGNVQPNDAHKAIVQLERYFPHLVVVTQNIDGLHQRAGSSDVIELHGSIQQHSCFNKCLGDPTIVDIDTLTWDVGKSVPTCPHCGGLLRPHVVWFTEMLPAAALQRAEKLFHQTDLALVIGTNGHVYPAAGLPHIVHQHGGTIIEININPSELTPYVDIALEGPAGVLVPQLVAGLTTTKPD